MYNLQHPELTEKYKLLTLESIDSHASSLGFARVALSTKRPRKGSYKGQLYGMYVARYRPTSATGTGYDGPELVVFNSNDGTRALRIFYGFYRGVCANGLIFGDSIFKTGRMVHTGTGFNSHVDQAFDAILQQRDAANDLVEKLKTTVLSGKDVHDMVYKSLKLRDKDILPMDIITGLVPRRVEDASFSAWSVMNMLQEYLVLGGYRINDGRSKKRLTSPSELIRVNTGITTLFKELVTLQ